MEPHQPPYVLSEDEPFLPTGDRRITRSWVEHHKDPDFGKPGDKRLHLGLLPHPYAGDVENASIYVLMLNPGVGYQDYFGEYEAPAYRKAVLATLRQRMPKGVLPFMYLDPQFPWHGGFNWWHGKLAGVIEELRHRWGFSFAEARARLARQLASIELVPYHSESFDNTGGLARKLLSAQLAREFVHDHVLTRVREGRAVVIVARKVKLWGLPQMPGVIKYSAAESRRAHLGPQSRGGRAILRHLGG